MANASGLLPVGQHGIEVQTIRSRERAISFANTHDHGAVVLDQTSEMTPDIAQALYHHAFACKTASETDALAQVGMAKEFLQHVSDAAASGFTTAPDPPLGDGFARDARDGVYAVGGEHVVGIGDPGHLAFARAQIWSWDIDTGSDKIFAYQFGGV